MADTNAGNGFERRIWEHNAPHPAESSTPTNPSTRPLVTVDAPRPLLWLIVERPQRDRGAILPIPPNATIGRQGDVRWPDARMSRQHARFVWVEHDAHTAQARFLLVPLQDRNGTMVNNRPVQQPAPIYENDVITMGDTHFVVKVLY